MKKLFDAADMYLRQSNWKDLALVKFCLAAAGTLLGMQVPKEKRKAVMVLAGGIFVVTYIPLMVKFFQILFVGDGEIKAS